MRAFLEHLATYAVGAIALTVAYAIVRYLCQVSP